MVLPFRGKLGPGSRDKEQVLNGRGRRRRRGAASSPETLGSPDAGCPPSSVANPCPKLIGLEFNPARNDNAASNVCDCGYATTTQLRPLIHTTGSTLKEGPDEPRNQGFPGYVRAHLEVDMVFSSDGSFILHSAREVGVCAEKAPCSLVQLKMHVLFGYFGLLLFQLDQPERFG